MKTKLTGITLFALTLTAVAVYPSIKPATVPVPQDGVVTIIPAKPVVDVVFVLDTTGSMSGLIQTAKEKIWSIATTMTSAQQVPDIRIGLVGYRDRGDDYVTKVVNLSDDLDSVYASLMDFEAGGGGDGPESVNKALSDAVYKMAWSQDPRAYKVVFLVGDAPPHMDYQDEARYPEILTDARERGIVVNTIQCGEMPSTVQPWQQIAGLGSGRYFQVEQAGSAVAVATPFDEKIAALTARLDATRLYYGSKAEKALMEEKISAAEKLNAESSVASRARRGAFNTSAGGRKNLLGDKELVDAVSRGEVELDAIETEELPAALQALDEAAREAKVQQLAEERQILHKQIRELADQRGDYIEAELKKSGGADDSLDHQLYRAVQEQAAASGLEYKDGPDY